MKLFKETKNGKDVTRAIGPIPDQSHCLCRPVARNVRWYESDRRLAALA
jgi:hypothetical protein